MEGLVERHPEVIAERDPARYDRIDEHDGIGGDIANLVSRIRRKPSNPAELAERSSCEIKHHRRVLFGNLAAILRVLLQCRLLNDRAPRGELELQLRIFERDRLLRNRRKSNLRYFCLVLLSRDGGRGNRGFSARVRARGYGDIPRLRGALLRLAHFGPDVPRKDCAQHQTDNFLDLIHNDKLVVGS